MGCRIAFVGVFSGLFQISVPCRSHARHEKASFSLTLCVLILQTVQLYTVLILQTDRSSSSSPELSAAAMLRPALAVCTTVHCTLYNCTLSDADHDNQDPGPIVLAPVS